MDTSTYDDDAAASVDEVMSAHSPRYQVLDTKREEEEKFIDAILAGEGMSDIPLHRGNDDEAHESPKPYELEHIDNASDICPQRKQSFYLLIPTA